MENPVCVSRDQTTCGTCQYAGKTADVVAYCFECKQNLCEECRIYHKRFPATREHQMEILKKRIGRQPLTEPAQLLTRCDYHETKDVKYYCFNHKEVYCGLCRAVKHSRCNEKPISEICDLLGLKELELALATLDQLTGTLKAARHERLNEIDELVRMKTVCIDEVNKLKQRLSMLFEQLDRNVAHNISEVDNRLEQYSETAALFIDALGHVSSLADQIKTGFQCSDKGMILAAQTKAQKMKMDYTCLMDNSKANMSPLRLTFQQDVHIVDILSTCESLGEMKLERNETRVPVQEQNCPIVSEPMNQPYAKKATAYIPQKRDMTTPITSTLNVALASDKSIAGHPSTQFTNYVSAETLQDSSDAQSHSADIESTPWTAKGNPTRLYSSVVEAANDGSNIEHSKARNSSDLTETVQVSTKNFLGMKLAGKTAYPISIDSDRGDCDITGSAFLPHGTLIICDHFNKTIKMLNKSFCVTISITFDTHPWDVAAYSCEEFAVTLTKKKMIQFVKIESDAFVLNGSFHTKRPCWGIEAYGELLIITFHDNPGNGAIEIRTKTGQVLQAIKSDGDDSSLFVSPFYISLDPRKEHIYVSDGKNNSVTCLTIKGKLLTTTKSDDLRWPKGIIIDDNSNIIVSAHFGNQLKILQQRGCGSCSKYRDTNLPQTLAFSWDDLKMVVGSSKGREITVYTFRQS